MKNLPELIAEHKGKRSYAALAEATDGRISPQQIQRIATNDAPKTFPDAATLQGLSTALDLPITGIVLAAAKSLDLNVQPYPDVEEMREQLLYHRLHADAYKKQLATLQARITNTTPQKGVQQP